MTIQEATTPIDVLLIDDHASFRQVLAMYFRTQEGFGEVREADSSDTAREALARHTAERSGMPLVVLLDLQLGPEDGAELIPHVERVAPTATIVVLSAVEDPAHLGRVVEAGATALLSKRSDVADIVEACRRAAAGTVQIDTNLAIRLMRAASRERADREQIDRVRASLTSRELEVLTLVASGKSDREIADDLHIAYETVRTHVANSHRKLGLNNRIAAVLYCIRHGLIKLG